MPIPNVQHSSNWRVVFSNIPTVLNYKVKPELYNLYVKSVTIPDHTIQMYNSDYRDYTYLTPITRGNTELYQLQIEFKVSEDFKNYYNFFRLMQMMRFDDEKNGPHSKLKDLNINSIYINIKDNQKREKVRIIFKNAFLSSLSSLPFVYGSIDEMSFTTTFHYQESDLVLLDTTST